MVRREVIITVVNMNPLSIFKQLARMMLTAQVTA
jgi:hypothetical protein